MQLFVRSLSGRTCSIQADACSTVASIKHTLQASRRMPDAYCNVMPCIPASLGVMITTSKHQRCDQWRAPPVHRCTTQLLV